MLFNKEINMLQFFIIIYSKVGFSNWEKKYPNKNLQCKFKYFLFLQQNKEQGNNYLLQLP